MLTSPKRGPLHAAFHPFQFLILSAVLVPPVLAARTLPARAYAVLFRPGLGLNGAMRQASAQGWRIVRVGMVWPAPVLILVPGPGARAAGIFTIRLPDVPGCGIGNTIPESAQRDDI